MNIFFRFFLVGFLTLNYLTSYSQAIRCPLRGSRFIDSDTTLNVHINTIIGIGFKGSNDSVFSILAGVVIKSKMYGANKHSITIQSKNKVKMTYSFIRKASVKVGDNIVEGQLIGLLSPHELSSEHILSILVKKNNTTLNRREHVKFFRKCIHD